MIGADDYNFSDSDTPLLYDPDQNGNQSVRSLTTRDKFLEFDVPNLPGQAYEVVLRVQNHVGTTHRDTLIITIEQPLDMENINAFSGVDYKLRGHVGDRRKYQSKRAFSCNFDSKGFNNYSANS